MAKVLSLTPGGRHRLDAAPGADCAGSVERALRAREARENATIATAQRAASDLHIEQTRRAGTLVGEGAEPAPAARADCIRDIKRALSVHDGQSAHASRPQRERTERQGDARRGGKREHGGGVTGRRARTEEASRRACSTPEKSARARKRVRACNSVERQTQQVRRRDTTRCWMAREKSVERRRRIEERGDELLTA